jgi:nucleoid-associated protein YgaU
MPVSPTSRYRDVQVYHVTDEGEKTYQAAIGIRPYTLPATPSENFSHVTIGGETLEYLSWRYYGASEFWWRIADANALFFPFTLPPGVRLMIPAIGQLRSIDRRRRF